VALLALAGAGQAFDLQLHQPLGGKADHFPQQIGVGGLFHERAQVHGSLNQVGIRNPTLPANHL
jgi:hypothetical protein